MRRLLAVAPIVVVGLLAGCSSTSSVSSDKAAVASDLHTVKVDQAALAKTKMGVVLCIAGQGCPAPIPSSSVPPSSQVAKDTRRLSSDEFRLEGAEKQLATDEAASK